MLLTKQQTKHLTLSVYAGRAGAAAATYACSDRLGCTAEA